MRDLRPTYTPNVDPLALREAASRALEGLANPHVRYDWEACNRHVNDLRGACSDLGRVTGTRWNGMITAIESTDKFLLEFRRELSKFQHLVNMPERIQWLRREFAAACGEQVSNDELAKFRHWFTETPRGTLNVWDEQAIKAGQLIRIGMFRSEVRGLRSRLMSYEEHYESVQQESAATTFHAWVADAHLWIANARGALNEAQRATRKGAELLPLLERYTAQSFDFTMKVGRDSDPKTHFRQFLTAAGLLVDQIERESRILFGDALDLKMLRDRQLDVSIREETGKPNLKVVHEIRSMMSEWLIDYERREPQRGFGRVYSENEIQDFCGVNKGRLFTVKLGSETVGHYLIFVDQQTFPAHVREALAAAEKAGDYMEVIPGWAEMVGLTRAGRDIAHARGLDLYTLLHEAVRDTFATFQVEKVFGSVREGTFANLSKSDHLKRGWDETGVTVHLGARNLPYQVIRMVLSPAGMWGVVGN